IPRAMALGVMDTGRPLPRALGGRVLAVKPEVGRQRLDTLRRCGIHGLHFVELLLDTRRAAAAEVALATLCPHDLAASGNAKALGCRFVCLELVFLGHR